MTQPLACDMTAIPADQREAHHALVRRMVDETAKSVQELRDGFELQFAASEYYAVAEYVGRERLRCPLLESGLLVPPGGAPLELRLKVAAEGGGLIRAELGVR